jgi:hypothetical protein
MNWYRQNKATTTNNCDIGMRILLVLVILIMSAGQTLFDPPANGATKTMKADYYIATNGNDTWSGKLAAPNKHNTDGPFATISRAQSAIRSVAQAESPLQGPFTVAVRGGVYKLANPITFGPADSGTATSPVIYEAYTGERPVFSGGEVVYSGPVTEGKPVVVHLADVAAGTWNFIQLWDGNLRRYRTRLPENGYFTAGANLPPTQENVSKGFDQLAYTTADIKPDMKNLGDVEVIPFHIWTASRFRIKAIDPNTKTIAFMGHTAGTAGWENMGGHRFIVENVSEALGQPARWYLDRPTGTLTYYPAQGETHAELIAPRLSSLLELTGDPEHGNWIKNITLNGLTFEYANWVTPDTGESSGQSDTTLGGALRAVGVANVHITNCTVAHVGEWAVDLGEACQNNTVRGCQLTDLGAGGIKLGTMDVKPGPDFAPDGAKMPAAPGDNGLDLKTGGNVIDHCTIAQGGRLLPAGCGVWFGQTASNKLTRNVITDFYYTAISIGWTWGYAPTIVHDNLVAYNTVSRIGQGVLSDMGAIYTLGKQPGTVIEHNNFSDIVSFDYGGWGIYFDEGSSNITARDNYVYHTKTGGFHQHYGENNVVTNNVFADSLTAQLQHTRAEDHLTFDFNHNVVLYKTGTLFNGNWHDGQYAADYNIYWDSGQPVSFEGKTLAQWQAGGHDQHSVIADPSVAVSTLPGSDDVHVAPGPNAARLGITPFDVAPYDDNFREATANPAWPTINTFDATPKGK